mmetsp:Transcript_28455/g.90666  ORF Transcript_28455/g.90666 Transcript_28455/m.90666 type:complete len:282 (+) Transcript_28455:739-1584(+)
MPISLMSPSVLSSLDVEHRKIASGYSKARLFFMSLMSKELPWKPWTSTKRCTPRYSFGADGATSSEASGRAGDLAAISPGRGAYLCSKMSGRISSLGISDKSSMASSDARSPNLRKFSADWECVSQISTLSAMTSWSLIASLTMEVRQRAAICRSQVSRKDADTSRAACSSTFSALCQVSRIRQDAVFMSYARCAAIARGFTSEPSLASRSFRNRVPWPLPAPFSVQDVERLSPLVAVELDGTLPLQGSCSSGASTSPRTSHCTGVRHSERTCLSQAASFR